MKYLKKYKFKFNSLTPIHIGAGEKISIFDYKVFEKELKDNESRKSFDYFLGIFNHANIYGSLSRADKIKLTALAKSDKPQDIITLREMLAENAKDKDHFHYKSFAHKDFYDHYINKKNQLNNQCGLNLFARNGFIPYVPGSSIKGAIRTGILNSLFNACDSNRLSDISRRAFSKRGSPDARYAEFNILNALDKNDKPKIDDDPFGGLLISDVNLINGDIFACKLDKYRYSEKKQIFDVLSNQKNQSGMELNFELANFKNKTLEIIVNSKKFNLGHELLVLLDCCDKFTRRVLEDERKRLFDNKDSMARETPFKPSEISESYNAVRSTASGIDKGKFLLRIGFSSGYDATTIKKIRNYAEPKPGKMGMGWGYSKNLFRKNPLGFVLLELESEE